MRRTTRNCHSPPSRTAALGIHAENGRVAAECVRRVGERIREKASYDAIRSMFKRPRPDRLNKTAQKRTREISRRCL